MLPENYKPSKYVLCYIDVIGTKSLIKSNVKEAIESLWIVSHGLNKELRSTKNDCIIKSFSDNYLIAHKIEDTNPIEALEELIGHIGYAVDLSLIAKNLLIRGSIVIGDMYIDNDIMIGEAIIKAHYLESEACIYPRIMLDNTLFEYINKNKIEKNLNGSLYCDFDGTICLNYLKFINQELLKNVAKNYISFFNEEAENLEKEGKHKESLKNKWMENYFREYIKQNNLI